MKIILLLDGATVVHVLFSLDRLCSVFGDGFIIISHNWILRGVIISLGGIRGFPFLSCLFFTEGILTVLAT